jgi:multidrug resistance efflux pump
MNVQSLIRTALTTVVVVAAALIGYALWKHYMYSPWTRDGRVRAEIVHVAPDVSGLVAQVEVRDNQLVKGGQVLFRIDPSRFQLALARAEADLGAAQAAARAAGASIFAASAGTAASQADYEKYRAQAERRERAASVISAEARADAVATARAAQAAVERARANRDAATASQAQALAAVEQAQAALELARLNLERATVRASAPGYITNLNLRVGDYASAGSARLALVRSDSLWVYGYFEETKLPRIHPGDAAEVRLMSGGRALHGVVEGIARGITDADNPTSSGDLLASVSPTFNWIRLAQRVPVRVRIDPASIPQDMVLAAGMTASVTVHPDSGDAQRKDVAHL